ncbi:response regulator [Eubacteriales bacterium OttesenSCG-928-G02]|nr:response regulator [Eubacteriales bacterium OttesenSCG-928-G02]
MEKKILVVDDTAFMAAVISKVLESANYKVIKASSGEEALEYLSTEKPDLILLDVVMTGMSGYDVLNVLRNDFRYNLIPIIMLTGQNEEEDKLKGLEMGADDYIVKPFNNKELLARVKNTLVRLERSRGANPLTGLRGNNDIETELAKRLDSDVSFAVLYFDLNNFKPYNDIYGFANGDLVIKLTADIISENVVKLGSDKNFVGHIGGDDFVVVCESNEAIPISQSIIAEFDTKILSLYNEDDLKRGYLTAKDRNGNTAQFGILGLSIAIVFSERHTIADTVALAEIAAELKKEAKTVSGGTSAYVY